MMRNNVHILKRAIPDTCSSAEKASELHLGSGAPVALRLSQHYHLMSAPHHKTSWLCNRTASANGGGGVLLTPTVMPRLELHKGEESRENVICRCSATNCPSPAMYQQLL